MSRDTHLIRTLEGQGSEARLRRLSNRFRRVSHRIDRRTALEHWLIWSERVLIWFAGLCAFAAGVLLAMRVPL